MRHLIHCSQKGYECEIEVPSLDIDGVKEALSDLIDWCTDDELYKEGYSPCGFFSEASLDLIQSAMYGNVRKRLHEKFASIPIYGQTISADGSITSSVLLDIGPVIEKLIEKRESSEQMGCDSGSVIIRMLTAFLNGGIWQFGLRKADGCVVSDALQWPEPTTDGISVSWTRPDGALSPIIWFGMKGDDPIDCWSITLSPKMFEKLSQYENPYASERRLIERWKSFWFCSFWAFDWDSLFDNNGEYYIIWMFAECGMDEPEDELDRVRKSCPIELDVADTSEVLTKKINSLFQREYNDSLRQC
jgi:hypothetical protein